MHFSKLRLASFKSFVDPVEIEISSGLTGIVGPNGCGKSNLVEGLRWVMGESSAKQMRGDEMDDMIFGGTANRPARNIAEAAVVLDNRERQAPSMFNEFDEIEVIRHIERGHGSSYRVNGREVRARDVQLLFADAATGARSAAMVNQGRIDSFINAKPRDRRALLEEAAGITGLHSRRHEAELRLGAAETNLERLDDVIVTLETQLQGLKRQARQATRYRNLSGHIRRAEATLMFLRWRRAEESLTAAGNGIDAAAGAVDAAHTDAARCETRRTDAAALLPQSRQAEAEAAAALQRLVVAREGLDVEEARVTSAIADLEGRLLQIDSDAAREQILAKDAEEAVTRLENETGDIGVGDAAQAEAEAEARQRLDSFATEIEGLERELATLSETVAADAARRNGLERTISEMSTRAERLTREVEATAGERANLDAREDDRAALTRATEASAAARETLEKTQSEADAAEKARLSAQEAETAARAAYQDATTASGRIEAEQAALKHLLTDEDHERWPPVVDAVQVAPGFEAALGAALGDDLSASAEETAPAYWRTLPDLDDAPALPAGTEPLSRFVTAPPALARRLSQTGVIGDENGGGAARQAELARGQRLVSRAGDLWRWDGYSAKAGAAAMPAALRLTQRNRLDELERENIAIAAALAEAQTRCEAAISAAKAAAESEAEARAKARAAATEHQERRDAEAARAQDMAAANFRLAALDETAQRLKGELAEIETQLQATRNRLAALPDVGAARQRAEAHRNRLAELRVDQLECRADYERLRREAEARALRQREITAECQSWAQRAKGARSQLAELAQRREEAAAECEMLRARPAEIVAERGGLLDRIEAAEAARRAKADILARAESELGGLDRAAKAAEAVLAAAREEMVRAEAARETARVTSDNLRERIAERLDCAPDALGEIAGIDAEAELPDAEILEKRAERLVRERENMGAVNLRAEDEAGELEQRIASMQEERADLTAAIQRLRQGIAKLNHEGRERLLVAFEEVDRHFRELFTRLFGGGRAHLKLIDADDPLDAGLEIMASPPGKRLQAMSLLSGGERALTALSLLFAVFMTNPAPICVLDEADAALDDANVDRFCSLVEEISHTTGTGFLMITHHRITMARVDRLFGVTMSERGVSQLVSVDLQTAEQLRATA